MNAIRVPASDPRPAAVPVVANPLRRAAVTGAGGLLGGAVVRDLLGRGVEVVAIVRNGDRARHVLGDIDGIRLHVGDVRDTPTLAPALRGVDAIIHTAAYFREYYQPAFDRALLEHTNVATVADLIGAADHADVPVFVHISSSGTLGPTPREQSADEDTPPGRWSARNRYYASKVAAEQLIDRVRQTHRVHVPVIVPGWMWGPGDAAPTASGQLFLSIANARAPGVPRVRAHIVDARDVAHACVRAAETAANRRYVVAGERHELAAIGAQIAQLCGVSAPRAVAPRLAWATSALLQLADQLRGRPPLVTPRATRVLLDGNRQQISSARAQSELGLAFRPLTATLSDEADWFRRHNYLPRRRNPQPVGDIPESQ